jgi:hypothetical protein
MSQPVNQRAFVAHGVAGGRLGCSAAGERRLLEPGERRAMGAIEPKGAGGGSKAFRGSGGPRGAQGGAAWPGAGLEERGREQQPAGGRIAGRGFADGGAGTGAVPVVPLHQLLDRRRRDRVGGAADLLAELVGQLYGQAATAAALVAVSDAPRAAW